MNKHVNNRGYTTVQDEEGIYGTIDAWVPEHRLVMAKFIGVPLPHNAHVHHINGNKSDNRIENLAIVNNAGHKAIHALNPTKTMIEKEYYTPEFVGKEKWLKIRCPQCGKIFFRPVSQSSLKLNKKTDCCSSVCAQKLNNIIERNGVTAEIQNAIDTSIICEFKANGKFMRSFVSHPPKDFEINDQGLYVRKTYHQFD